VPGTAAHTGHDIGDLLGRRPAQRLEHPVQLADQPGTGEVRPQLGLRQPRLVSSGRDGDDPALSTFVRELSLKSEDFRRLWADHEVKECAYGVKRVRHPVAGLLTLLGSWASTQAG
jgi:hypothetical protein